MLFCALACSTACVVPAARAGAGQAKKHSPRNATTSAWSKFDCGAGAELRLSKAAAIQGSLVLAEVRSAKTITGVSGTWVEKTIPFWQADAPGPTNLWRALLGVDLELTPGDHKLAISGKSESGDALSCYATVAVKAGKFTTEHLKVAPNFVEPNPEQLAKAEEDRKKLKAIFATVTPEKLWTGKFRVPLDGITTGGNFGKRRVLNGTASSPHTGVDFPSPTGTPVHAAQRGRVALAEPLYFSGNTVLLDHGWGVYTLYGHFSEIDVKAGDLVETGTVLGKVGATGRVTGPHLHWGLTVDQARVNALAIVGRE
jgi:murein DD-endopeptidase MepM/ murein hydrolase activator NlpD